MVSGVSKALGGLAVVLLVASCSNLTEDQCTAGNWEQIGLDDGLAGRGGNQFWQNRLRCAGIGGGADKAAWYAGNADGLAQYCSPENAYELGRTGGRIEAVCTPEQYTSGMREAFEAGQRDLAADLVPVPDVTN